MIQNMLAAMRKHAYSWTTRIMLGLLAAVFCFWGFGGGMFNQVHPVATVNHQQILADQVDQQADQIRTQIEQMYGENAGLMLKNVNVRQEALQRLIDQMLIDSAAERLGLRVDNAQLEQSITSIPGFQVDGHFDFDRYQQMLRANNLQPAAFEAQQRTMLLRQMMQKMVYDGVQVSDAEARRDYDLQNEVIALSYFEIPYDRFAAAIHPTLRQIGDYYKDHGEDFREPDKIQIEYIYYDPQKLAASVPLRDVDIQDYYGDNQKTLFTHPEEVRVRHILIAVGKDASPAEQAAAKRKADKLLDQIRHGADFGKLARQYSDDPGSKDSGGDLGFFPRGQMIKPFEDAAFALKPGETVMVKTQFGYHILQLEAKKPEHMDTLAEARPAIVAALRQKAGTRLARRALDQDLAAALGGKSLYQLANARGLTAAGTAFFSAETPPADLAKEPNLVREAFKLQKGDLRALDGAKGPYLVDLLNRNPSHIPALKEIEERVSDAYVRATAAAQADTLARKLAGQIHNLDDFKRVAKQNGFEIYTTPAFERSTGSVPGIGEFREVTDAAGVVSKVPGVLDHPMEREDNSYIFALVSRAFPSDVDWKASADDFKRQLLDMRREQAWSAYLDDLKHHAEIAIDTNQLGNASSSAPM